MSDKPETPTKRSPTSSGSPNGRTMTPLPLTNKISTQNGKPSFVGKRQLTKLADGLDSSEGSPVKRRFSLRSQASNDGSEGSPVQRRFSVRSFGPSSPQSTRMSDVSKQHAPPAYAPIEENEFALPPTSPKSAFDPMSPKSDGRLSPKSKSDAGTPVSLPKNGKLHMKHTRSSSISLSPRSMLAKVTGSPMSGRSAAASIAASQLSVPQSATSSERRATVCMGRDIENLQKDRFVDDDADDTDDLQREVRLGRRGSLPLSLTSGTASQVASSEQLDDIDEHEAAAAHSLGARGSFDSGVSIDTAMVSGDSNSLLKELHAAVHLN